ncbi:MAG TPA: hypothetical protein VN624_01565 [Rhodanobacter sp.]|nr:hypothetical protein [Rhodanobacter sp.]
MEPAPARPGHPRRGDQRGAAGQPRGTGRAGIRRHAARHRQPAHRQPAHAARTGRCASAATGAGDGRCRWQPLRADPVNAAVQLSVGAPERRALQQQGSRWDRASAGKA